MEAIDSQLYVTVGPAEEPLSLTEGKLHLRVTHASEDDLITSYMKTARQQVEVTTRRCLVTQSLALKLGRFPCGKTPILLRRPPIQSVTSITYVDTDGATQTLGTDIYRFILNEPGWVELKYGQVWPATRCESQAVTVNFIAGYGDAEDVPEMAKSAIRLILGDLYANREQVNIGNITSDLPAVKAIMSLLGWGDYT